MKHYVLALFGTAGLFGCSAIPSAGPTADELVAKARAHGELRITLIEVDDRTVQKLRSEEKPRFARLFERDRNPPALRIAVGDRIEATIWQPAAMSLVAVSSDASDASAAPRDGENAQAIPAQLVGPDGGISIPYAGRVRAAGGTPADVEAAIEKRLAGKATVPQAVVVVTRSAANSVALTGAAIGGALVPLSPAGDRLSQVIAAAGGAKTPISDTLVRLSRGNISAAIPLATLLADRSEDIYAEPGDVLTLERVPRTFSVFGAAGRNALITFDAARLSLAEALAKAGGLRDGRADPSGVFLFRYETARVVRALGGAVAGRPRDGRSPVLYRFDLARAGSNFLARRFPVRDGDVIYVAAARTNAVGKMFQALQNLVNPFITGIVVCGRSRC
jgi:polysaccharide export outer membrane protein